MYGLNAGNADIIIRPFGLEIAGMISTGLGRKQSKKGIL